jgi:hypothetical protein
MGVSLVRFSREVSSSNTDDTADDTNDTNDSTDDTDDSRKTFMRLLRKADAPACRITPVPAS